jgi:hypothetical protein
MLVLKLSIVNGGSHHTCFTKWINQPLVSLDLIQMDKSYETRDTPLIGNVIVNGSFGQLSSSQNIERD